MLLLLYTGVIFGLNLTIKTTMKINKTDLAYVAAIIDAESCICISRSHTKNRENYKESLTTSMNDLEAVLFIKQLFGGNNRIGNGKRRDGHIRHNCHVISYTGEKMKRILRLTLPYIKVKKEQAALTIKFIETKQKAAQKRELFQPLDQKTLSLCRTIYNKVKHLKTSNWIKNESTNNRH